MELRDFSTGQVVRILSGPFGGYLAKVVLVREGGLLLCVEGLGPGVYLEVLPAGVEWIDEVGC